MQNINQKFQYKSHIKHIFCQGLGSSGFRDHILYAAVVSSA